MAELYLGYAAFAYYTTKNGYELSKRGPGYLIIEMPDGKEFQFLLYTDSTRNYCGCVYTNDEDIKKVFNGNNKLIKILMGECCRPPWQFSDREKINHCNILPPLRGNINLVIGGDTIICQR